MRTTRQKSKAPMESPMGHANPQVQIPEEEEPQESAGESAVVVAVNGAAAAVEITVRIAKARLHCPVCTLPLKPPIFHVRLFLESLFPPSKSMACLLLSVNSSLWV